MRSVVSPFMLSAGLLLGAAIAMYSLPKEYNFQDWGKRLAVKRYLTAHPTASDEALQKVADQTPSGIKGLHSVLFAPSMVTEVSEVSDISEAFQDSKQEATQISRLPASGPLQLDHGAVDPNKLKYIDEMLISDEVKNKIRKHYLETGVMLQLSETK